MNQIEISSIIFVKLDHIGDMILTTPVFRAVKERFPQCSLGVMCSSKGKLIIENNPFVDDIYIYNPDMFDRANENNVYTKMHDFLSVLEVRKKKYDVCVSLREDHNNAVIQKMLGAKYNISFSTDSPYPEVFDYSVPNPGGMHVALKNFELLKLIDVLRPHQIKAEMFTTDEDEKWADEFLRENGVSASDTVVAISPGGGWFLNWWPWQNYAKLCNMLLEYDEKIKIVLVGGAAEREVVDKIKAANCCKVIDSCGKTTLQQLSALYKRTCLVVCNDGGTMHVASTAGVPMVALFGPSPSWFYPLGEDNVIINKGFACSPCPQFQAGEKPKCLNNKCMKSISVKEVYRAAVQILSDK